MSFGDDIRKHRENVANRQREIFHGVTEEVHRSIVFGSEITGAPGQPVQSGALRASWTPQFLDENTWQDSTNIAYAQSIEDGISYAHGGTPLTLRSPTGGFHSVGLTRAGFSRIVEAVRNRIAK